VKKKEGTPSGRTQQKPPSEVVGIARKGRSKTGKWASRKKGNLPRIAKERGRAVEVLTYFGDSSGWERKKPILKKRRWGEKKIRREV